MTPIVFLDLETTGLDPQLDHILQIAIQVVDGETIEPIGEPFVSDVALTEAAAGRLYMNPFVRDMHRKTGLLDRLESAISDPGQPDRGPYGLDRTQGATLAFLRARGLLPREGALPRRPTLTLAGNSVHFDLAFLRTHMPRLAAMFSHRLLDVSVLRMFEDRWGSGEIAVENTLEHDALADVRSSIEQLRRYVARRSLLGQFAADAGYRS